MISLNNNVMLKKNKFLTFITFTVIIISSRANFFAYSDEVKVLFALFLLIIFFRKNLRFDEIFVRFLLILFLLFLMYFFIWGSLNYYAYLRLFTTILIAYLFIKIVNKKFIPLYINIIYLLSVVSLIAFGLMILFPYQFHTVNGMLENIFPFLEVGGPRETNSIIYDSVLGEFRNAGFAWEPGGFAAFVLLALFFEISNENKLLLNRKFLIFSITILSTISTMAVIAYVFILFYWLVVNKKFVPALITVFSLFLILQFVNTDFMREDLAMGWQNRDTVLKNEFSFRNQKLVSLGRFGSLLVDSQDFVKSPLIGYGFEIEKRTQGMYTYLQRTSGLSDYMAKFGLLGFSFLLISLTLFAKRNLKLASEKSNASHNFIFTLFILLITFSNPIILEPLFLILIVEYFSKNGKEGTTNNNRNF